MEINDISANNPNCKHEYFIDSNNVGTCRHCHISVQFSKDGRQPPTLLKPGLKLSLPGEEIKPAAPDPLTKPAEKLTESLTRKSIEKCPTDSYERIKWSKKHRAEIISDAENIGYTQTLAKWGITAKSLGQFLKHSAKNKPMPQEKPIRENTPETKIQPLVGDNRKYNILSHDQLTAEVNYLRGWQTAAREFLKAGRS